MTFSVDNVFRLLNFLVVCVGAAYLMRRYGILQIVSSMRLQKHKQEELHREYNNLLQQYDFIKLQAEEQEHSYIAMKEKFHVWQTKVQHDDMIKQAMLLACEQELQKKQLIKLQSLQQQQIVQQQLPTILQEISDDLKNKFERNSVLQKEYTTELIKFISEREL